MHGTNRILLITPTCDGVINFRKQFIIELITNNINVSVITFDDVRKEEILSLGVDFYCVKDENRGLNPFKILFLKRKLCKLIKQINPDSVFTFMLKPNLFGVPAAKKAGVLNIYSMVEGAGDVFINNSLKWKLIRFFVCVWYKKAFKISKKVFFLNSGDIKEFISRKLVKEGNCEQIFGIGVDLERFNQKPIVNYNRFLMIARMLKTKGVFEYCRCARMVKQKYPDAQFDYLGAEGTVKLSDIQEYIDDGSINYLGTTKDVRPFIENCGVFVLPSYREGMPVSVMEAQAMGRMIITCDTNGCNETVKERYNGFLCKVGDCDALTRKAFWCMENADKVDEMGKNARIFAEENFNSKKINKKIFKVLNEDFACLDI